MGDSHGIYNPTNESVRWLNFAVSDKKGGRDNYDLNDSRVGASLDPVPVFVSARLEKEKLKTKIPKSVKKRKEKLAQERRKK